MAIMYIWNYGTIKKHEFDVENKVSMNRIVSFGPGLGMVRVPGIGLVYSNLVTGVPAVFGHFVTNLPAFHQVLVFVCVKSVQVPYVKEEERLLISRVGPKEYGMFRCVVRYGYKDVQHENYEFENRLVSGLIQFVEEEDEDEDEDRFLVAKVKGISIGKSECGLKEESMQIVRAKESGVAFILGHSYAKAKKPSSFVKKFVINVVFAFLSKNCREPDVLYLPHTSLLEVGMIYYV